MIEKCPDKKFVFMPFMHYFSMKKIILENLYQCLEKERYEIELDEEVIKNAYKSLENMHKFGEKVK
ncbi:Quinolinate synthetase A protein [Clostridium grantii DSM 8605]|uniref:Quinolinate synthetase A protein n=1 Tax=Clostridium grantii DSM 8605 TaxID=1121316 RepID=A0A1M5X1Z3_9CLOT|nr:quinolinate synthase NadA [Clostridium grantii]SHH93632.1 Quinolinate synthetase A protein [Clostridium grantii DSM 8605]